MRRLFGLALGSITLCGGVAVLSAAEREKPHPYRLPYIEIKTRVLWGSSCEAPDGTALSFGGEDQESEDGQSHTRVRVNGEWIDLKDELEKANPNQSLHDRIQEIRTEQKNALARARHLYFEGLPAADLAQRIKFEVLPAERNLDSSIGKITDQLGRPEKIRVPQVWNLLESARGETQEIAKALEGDLMPEVLGKMREAQMLLERAADLSAAEPPARALSPIVFDPKSKLFVVFGGDHFDYLTNDTWTFDPASRRWSLRHPASAPPPRANHSWKAGEDGKLILTGGYAYFSNTDYMGGQYADLKDGDWTYDVAKDSWAGGASVDATSRVYRTGPFLPEFFYDAPRPDGGEFQAQLAALKPNVWTRTHPPKLPEVNRDWGSAVIDPRRDLILRWSGGHCAHGGTDVIEYHLASNRWELCYPVEFPLGQLYTNTEYPHGYNFNHRPWISGHTYQNYGVDPALNKMVFLGHPPFSYFYDPDLGDWATRSPMPKSMNYSGAMYTLTTTATPHGLVCWTEQGDVFLFDARAGSWNPLHLNGEKLPGAVVDSSTVVYDGRRDRLLFMRKLYGDDKYNGEIHALDMKTLAVTHLSPAGMEAARAIPYLPQIRVDPEHDLLLAGCTLAPDGNGVRRTPGYDCAANKWITFRITGEDPSGKEGRNVSLGMMYDFEAKTFLGGRCPQRSLRASI